MPNIYDFKARLAGGGARANQFKVTMPFPGYSVVGGETQQMAFLCTTAQLPGMTIAETPIPFRGRTLYVAGDTEFETWETTVINDTDFMVRNAMERWQNGINDLDTNTGLSNTADYQADLTVEQLDRDDTVLKSYILRGCFPQAIGNIDLAFESTNAIEEFTITWRYHHFEASAVNF